MILNFLDFYFTVSGPINSKRTLLPLPSDARRREHSEDKKLLTYVDILTQHIYGLFCLKNAEIGQQEEVL